MIKQGIHDSLKLGGGGEGGRRCQSSGWQQQMPDFALPETFLAHSNFSVRCDQKSCVLKCGTTVQDSKLTLADNSKNDASSVSCSLLTVHILKNRLIVNLIYICTAERTDSRLTYITGEIKSLSKRFLKG